MQPANSDSLRQLAMLLDFDDNRYGSSDFDAYNRHSHMIELPNAEIGGSSSPGDSDCINSTENGMFCAFRSCT